GQHRVLRVGKSRTGRPPLAPPGRTSVGPNELALSDDVGPPCKPTGVGCRRAIAHCTRDSGALVSWLRGRVAAIRRRGCRGYPRVRGHLPHPPLRGATRLRERLPPHLLRGRRTGPALQLSGLSRPEYPSPHGGPALHPPPVVREPPSGPPP